MATKADGCACYDNAAEDEPIFVLRAQDKLAADTISHWIRYAERSGVDPEKIDEARECEAAMREWPTQKLPD
jgi:hypothetical protein